MKKYILLILVSVTVSLFSSCKKEDQDTLRIQFDGTNYIAQVYQLVPPHERPEYRTFPDENGKQMAAVPVELIKSKERSDFSRPANTGDSYMIEIQKEKKTSLNIDAYINETEIKAWKIDQDTTREMIHLSLK